MLTVKPKLDVVVHIYLVNNLICVLLKGRSENNDLVVLSHQFDELDASWSHQEEAVLSVLYIMDQGLVQIKHQSVQSVFVFSCQWR